MVTIAEVIAVATRHHQAGQLADAERIYRQVLAEQPDQPQALHQLGMLAIEARQFDQAVALISRSIQVEPTQAAAHTNLAEAYRHSGRLGEAADCYRRALALQPTLLPAQVKLGAVLRQLGQHDEAIAALTVAIERKPDHFEARLQLGHALEAQSRLPEAIACFRQAVQIDPRSETAHLALADALQSVGQFGEAETSYLAALAISPASAAAHSNLGATLAAQEKYDEAIASYRRALELQPNLVVARSNLGSTLSRQDLCAEAAECYRQGREIYPGRDIWRVNQLGLCPAFFNSTAEILRYREQLLQGLRDLSREKLNLTLADLEGAYCGPAFNLQFQGFDDRQIREAFAQVFAPLFPRGDRPQPRSGRPRVGFVVTDRRESTFLKSMGAVVDRMDRERFELVMIGSASGVPRLQAGLTNRSTQFLPLPAGFNEMASAIHSARCDLLYYWEVGTDNTNYFLPFLRLAPAQCTSWGIQVTSGIAELDYYLSNELAETPQAADHYSEQLVLARTLLSYQRRVSLPKQPKPREAFGFANREHVYLCAQQLGKFHPAFDPILAGILRQDPRGIVALVEVNHATTVAGQLRRRFVDTMPDVAERIRFLPFQNREDYLSLTAAADVLLDPLHFGGVNSSYDGFSLGQPIVTLPSELQRGRYTLACYRKMGVDDCVATDAAQYVDIAVSLGADKALRQMVSAKIQQASAALFEDQQAVAEHERIFSELVERSRSGDSAGR